MSAHRPHAQTVRLTEAQHVLVRKRMFDDGMSWQRLLSACVNAYARGELHVDTAGDLTLDVPPEFPKAAPVVSYDEDPDALSLDDLDAMSEDDLARLLDEDTSRPYGSQTERTIGTRQLAELAEEQTGRRVSLPMLRELVRETYPQDDEPGPGTRYRWDMGDPEVEEIIEAIAEGALDEIRQNRLARAALDG